MFATAINSTIAGQVKGYAEAQAISGSPRDAVSFLNGGPGSTPFHELGIAIDHIRDETKRLLAVVEMLAGPVPEYLVEAPTVDQAILGGAIGALRDRAFEIRSCKSAIIAMTEHLQKIVP